MQIFTYWDAEKLPILNEYCIHTWRKYNPDVSITILNDTNIHQYVKTFPINYDKLIVQHKSDYIRTYLLYHYGGIWIDSTIIIKGKIGDIFDLSIKDKIQLIDTQTKRIFTKRYAFRYKGRHFHNNFMCCLKPYNELVKVWLNNFIWCIENLNAAYINKNTKFPEYFKDLYRTIKNGNDFKPSWFTYYLTHMNILSVLISNSNVYDEYYTKTDKTANFLLWINDKFHYEEGQTYLKIDHMTQKIISELIENNRLDEHPQLNTWIDKEYFKNN